MLLIGPLGTNFSEILVEILTFSFKKMSLKVSSAKWRPFCLGLNVLIPKDISVPPLVLHVSLVVKLELDGSLELEIRTETLYVHYYMYVSIHNIWGRYI